MGHWKEKLVFGAVALAFLIPIGMVQTRIDDDRGRVVFLRWIDNQQAYQGQALLQIVQESTEANLEEEAFFERVEEVGLSLSSDFRYLPVERKWEVLHSPNFAPLYEQFIHMVKEAKVTLAEGEIDWANPDVSANVGALVLGFRKLVADVLWLKVDEYWHLGLVERMLPMMETVITLDPQFIEAYALGAWHLSYNVTVMFHSADEKMKYIDQGIHLLKKGIKNNPRHSKLYMELGLSIYFQKLRDWEKAAYYLGESIKYEHEPWYERAYALSLERNLEEEAALAVLEDYDQRHPDFIMHKRAMTRIKQKLDARKLEENGELEKALEIWRFLKEDDGSDVVAPKEVARIEKMPSPAPDKSS